MKYKVEVDDECSCSVVEVEASSDEEALEEAERKMPSSYGTVCYTILDCKKE